MTPWYDCWKWIALLRIFEMCFIIGTIPCIQFVKSLNRSPSFPFLHLEKSKYVAIFFFLTLFVSTWRSLNMSPSFFSYLVCIHLVKSECVAILFVDKVKLMSVADTYLVVFTTAIYERQNRRHFTDTKFLLKKKM